MPITLANAAKPKGRVRPPITHEIDLTITPPATGYNGIGLNGTVPAGAITAGELVYLTAAKQIASLATAGASNANAANCVGVAVDQYPPNYGANIVGSSVPPGDPNVPQCGVYQDGDYLFNTTAADVYHAYDVVYLGADGRTVQKTASGTKIGYVSADQRPASGQVIQPNRLPITGAAGVQIYVRIQPALALQ